MPDPFANLKTLDDACDVKDVGTFDETLADPFDDVPDFDPAESPEVDVNATLHDAHLHRRTATRRLYVDYRPHPEAMRHLQTLPAEGETLHAVMCQKYSLWDLVPALIERTGKTISDLHVATLSYSKKTADDLLALLDDGHITRVSLIVSYYFKAQNRPLYDALVPPLRERGQRVLAIRNHAKLLLVKTAGAGCYTAEGSANLRSCKNLEQFCLTRCRKLYEFHRGWMEGELFANREEGK